jgi:hypothetical protein
MEGQTSPASVIPFPENIKKRKRNFFQTIVL